MEDQELFAAIGEVVVDAAVLEWQVAGLVAAIEGAGQSRISELAARTGEPVRQLEKQAALHPDLAPILADVKTVLGNRNRLVHSLALYTVEEDTGEEFHVFRYARGGSEDRVTVPQILECAEAIRAARMRVLRAWRRRSQP